MKPKKSRKTRIICGHCSGAGTIEVTDSLYLVLRSLAEIEKGATFEQIHQRFTILTSIELQDRLNTMLLAGLVIRSASVGGEYVYLIAPQYHGMAGNPS